ncbi:MAG: MBL fold metallo-hydrolase [Myxococcales bacterium FL481]|nr:MAG: MBL fold metallo-hydrolase [Myxococcales bacterium FL481]
MQIKYYGYNGFVIRDGQHVIAIDPGASLYLLGLGPVIPRSEWREVTHVVVTHGDPDHYWHADRVAKASGAPLICGSELVQVRDGHGYIYSSRAKDLRYATPIDRVFAMDPGDSIDVDGVRFEAIAANHGKLRISMLGGLVQKTFHKEPGERFALGCTGFVMHVGGLRIANLGDTMLLREWGRIAPDVLMIPIGGRRSQNTMDEDQALEAVEMLAPRLVIPCHYDCGLLFDKKGNPADAQRFKAGVDKLGSQCVIMQPGDEIGPRLLATMLDAEAPATEGRADGP